MTRYSDWFNNQNDDFKQEVNPNNESVTDFVDYKLKPINIEELKTLDSKYCSNDDLEAYIAHKDNCPRKDIIDPKYKS